MLVPGKDSRVISDYVNRLEKFGAGRRPPTMSSNLEQVLVQAAFAAPTISCFLVEGSMPPVRRIDNCTANIDRRRTTNIEFWCWKGRAGVGCACRPRIVFFRVQGALPQLLKRKLPAMSVSN
jgi:hypothetical protein